MKTKTFHSFLFQLLVIVPNLLFGQGIIIQPGARMTVENGAKLATTGTAGITIKSDATGTGSFLDQNTSGTNVTFAGTQMVERYVTGSSLLTDWKYHFVSVPLTAASNPTSNLFLGSHLYYFDETVVSSPDNGWVNMGSSTTLPLTVSRGYMIYYPGASTTINFAGSINTGTFDATVSYTSGAGSNNRGYNLVPNPYPSAIDWGASSGWTKTYIDDAVYVWNNGVYASYVNGSGINGGTRYISPGQSFFVYANGTADPVLSMDNRTRVHNSVSFLKNSQALPNVLSLRSEANGFGDETVVRFIEGSTNNYDGTWDAFKLSGEASFPVLGTLSSDNKFLSINSLPFTGSEVIVPVEFSVSSSSDVTFIVTGIETFATNIPIYLEDISLSKMINLRQNPVYTFAYLPSNPNDRFKLHFAGPIGMNEPSSVSGKSFISNGFIFIEVPGMKGETANIRIFNTIGQLLSSDNLSMNSVVRVDAPSGSGIFIVSVSTKDKNYFTKVFNK